MGRSWSKASIYACVGERVLEAEKAFWDGLRIQRVGNSDRLEAVVLLSWSKAFWLLTGVGSVSFAVRCKISCAWWIVRCKEITVVA